MNDVLKRLFGSCWPRHAWGRWEDIERGDIGRALGRDRLRYSVDPKAEADLLGQQVIGNYVVQRRICATCGRLAMRTVRTSL